MLLTYSGISHTQSLLQFGVSLDGSLDKVFEMIKPFKTGEHLQFFRTQFHSRQSLPTLRDDGLELNLHLFPVGVVRNLIHLDDVGGDVSTTEILGDLSADGSVQVCQGGSAAAGYAVGADGGGTFDEQKNLFGGIGVGCRGPLLADDDGIEDG